MTVNFTVTKKEMETIDAIAKRANKLFERFGSRYAVMDAAMDITAVHANGCPLRLEELLKSDDLNFSHDMGGIHQHLNRNNGKLEGFFVPRFAKAEGK